ncbi:MAG: heme ABC exporter ATP-binding protein CcmA [Actinomycetota bacterium]|nr:heme ABC exporter ATP-binding protein CcmA [Actinomycetota bacterium]
MIALESLSVVYGRTVALHDVTLELHPGITGLFGQNASGKTTLLRALAGLTRPTSGRVLVDGIPVALTDEGFRRRVGYAGHEPGLYARLTVAENLNLFARLYGVSGQRVEELLASLGIEDRSAKAVSALSAGLKRRAAVARAMLHEPDILLLDEPYANLDDEAADFVTQTILRWHAPGRLGVVATHGAKRVKAFASAGLILKRGEPVSYRVRTPIEATT